MTTKYQGFAEAWQAEMALARVRRFGFPEHEWQDLLQELALKVSQFSFNAAKSNGAKQTTVLRTIIDRHLSTRSRSKRRAEHSAKRFRRCVLHRQMSEDQVELRVDVRQLVETLTAKQQAVCAGLGRGESLTEIAEQLGRSLSAVRRTVTRIRRRFEEAGLKGWLED